MSQRLQSMPCWTLSALAHLIVLLVLMRLLYRPAEPEPVDVGLKVAVAPRALSRPPAYDPTAKRDVRKRPRVPGPTLLDPNERPIQQPKEVEEVTPDMPKGTSLEEVSDRNTDWSEAGKETGGNESVGIGRGVAGAFGERLGKGSLAREGGSGATEDAVLAALEWLRRHQSPDGGWKSAGFLSQCKQTCRNLDPARHGDGKGFPEHDVGVTALAMLAFAGYGHTHRDGIYEEYVDCLRKAVAYLKQVQVRSNDPTTNGRFGAGEGEQWVYDHAIATMAMAELLVMSNDVIGLRNSVRDAVRLCLNAQNDGFGWRYAIKPGDNDTSVTGWMVLALKTAKNANLGIPKEEYARAFAGALKWFDRATSASGKTGYLAPGDEGSRLAKAYTEPYPYTKELSCMTAVAVLCRIFAGEQRGSNAVRGGVKILMEHLPAWQEQKGRALSTINMYYWYYASYALFQFGGEPWKKWNEQMIKTLLASQRQFGKADTQCEDGSWDPIDEWGVAGGRVYATALGAMTFEVYYRFRRTQGAF